MGWVGASILWLQWVVIPGGNDPVFALRFLYAEYGYVWFPHTGQPGVHKSSDRSLDIQM